MIIEIVVQPAVMFSLPWMPLHTLKLIIILPTPHASRVVGMIAGAFELTQHVVERHQHIVLAVLVGWMIFPQKEADVQVDLIIHEPVLRVMGAGVELRDQG
jgi:hypothetical protein